MNRNRQGYACNRMLRAACLSLLTSAIPSVIYSDAEAANISRLEAKGKFDAIYVYGNIEPGDAEKFSGAVAAANQEGRNIAVVYLASRGGAVSEALEIGRAIRSGAMKVRTPYIASDEDSEFRRAGYKDRYDFIKQKPWKTLPTLECPLPAVTGSVVTVTSDDDPNCICASACALISYGGVDTQGIIGLHHSFLHEADGLSFGAMSSSLTESNTAVEEYLQEMRVPAEHREMRRETSSTSITYTTARGGDPIFAEYLLARCGARPEYAQEAALFFLAPFVEMSVANDSFERSEEQHDLSLIAAHLSETHGESVDYYIEKAWEMREAFANQLSCEGEAWRAAMEEGQE